MKSRYFQSTSDTETFYLIALSKENQFKKLQILLTDKGLTVLDFNKKVNYKDPLGIRQLNFKFLGSIKLNSLRTCALDILEAKFERNY